MKNSEVLLVVFDSTELLLNHPLQCTQGINSVSFRDNQVWYGSLIKLKCPPCCLQLACLRHELLSCWLDAGKGSDCISMPELMLARALVCSWGSLCTVSGGGLLDIRFFPRKLCQFLKQFLCCELLERAPLWEKGLYQCGFNIYHIYYIRSLKVVTRILFNKILWLNSLG